MVMRKVSSNSEPPMLSTVRMLRRLLRKAFLVTNRVRVILVNSKRGQVRMNRRTSLISIDEKVGHRQPAAAKNRKPSPLIMNTTLLKSGKYCLEAEKVPPSAPSLSPSTCTSNERRRNRQTAYPEGQYFLSCDRGRLARGF